MANRYWVGGAGTWDTSSTTHWSASSGGASGASVPTAADSVFFDSGSGTAGTVTMTGALTCLDITVSVTGWTFANGTSPTLAISGSMSLNSGTTWSSTGAITFNATTTGKTITTNGVNIPAAVTLNGVGGAWTLGSAYTSSGSLTITNGTFDTSSTGNYSVTVGIFSTNSNIRTINFNGSTVTAGGTQSINFSTSTNLTFNAGTSTIICTYTGGLTFAGGSQTFYNVSFSSSAATRTITGANTFNNLSFAAAGVGISNQVSFSANQTINGTLTVPAPTTGGTSRTYMYSSTFGTPITLTAAAVSLTDVDFTDITGAGTATWSGTRLGDAGGNSGITFPAAKTVYFVGTTSANWNASQWATSSGGSVASTNFPLPQDTAVIDNSSLNSAATLTLNSNYNIGTVTFANRTNAITFATGSQTPNMLGSWTNSSSVTLSGNATLTWKNRSVVTITSAGATWTQPINITAPGGTVQLNDAFTGTNATTITLAQGTFDANGYNVTAVKVADSGTLSRTLAIGSGTWTVSGSTTTTWSFASTGLTVTGTGKISMTGATAKTFAGGGVNYGSVVLDQGGAGTLTVSGSNTFGNITNSYGTTGATTITLTSSTTQTVALFTAAGTSGNLLTINSSTAGTQATIAYSGAGNVTGSDYLSVKDIAFTPGPSATGTTPYRWYVGANSVNNGNNTGALFIASGTTVYQITTAGSSNWTVPSDWNSANNTIHLIGGGGGSAGTLISGNNRAGGGGGGGGGYTKITNFSTSGGSSIAYVLGAGGTAGAANGNGGAGVATTWNSGAYSAGGGGGGSVSATPSSTGGTGGIGSTFNGGAGGAGSATTVASSGEGGGGGGGAGGPLGAGGAGGNGFASTTQALNAGGGGGGNGGGSAGGNASSGVGGTGGNNFNGTGGGASNTAGTLGGGGGGGVAGAGKSGSVGVDILNSIGGGGGGSGAAANLSGPVGIYGSGAGGSGTIPSGGTPAGAAGGAGLIVIVYVPSGVNAGAFFNFF